MIDRNKKDLMEQLGWARVEDQKNDNFRVGYSREIEGTRDVEVAGFEIDKFGDGRPFSGILRNYNENTESCDSIEHSELDELSNFALIQEIAKFAFSHILK